MNIRRRDILFPKSLGHIIKTLSLMFVKLLKYLNKVIAIKPLFYKLWNPSLDNNILEALREIYLIKTLPIFKIDSTIKILEYLISIQLIYNIINYVNITIRSNKNGLCSIDLKFKIDYLSNTLDWGLNKIIIYIKIRVYRIL
jgi:hypothetical protein